MHNLLAFRLGQLIKKNSVYFDACGNIHQSMITNETIVVLKINIHIKGRRYRVWRLLSNCCSQSHYSSKEKQTLHLNQNT